LPKDSQFIFLRFLYRTPLFFVAACPVETIRWIAHARMGMKVSAFVGQHKSGGSRRTLFRLRTAICMAKAEAVSCGEETFTK